MSLLPWSKKVEEKKPSTSLVVKGGEEPQSNNDIVVRPSSPVVVKSSNSLIKFKTREISIAGKKVKTDPYQLMRCIKRITQSIGEHKGNEDVYSLSFIAAMRKARNDLVLVLENEWSIHWQLDNSGESIFHQ